MMLNELLLVIHLLGGKETASGLRVYTARSMPIRAVFQNAGTRSVSLLATFDPAPIFFSFNINAEDGTPIDVPGGGKIDIDKMQFLNLGPGQQHVHAIDLAAVLRQQLPQGNYSFSLQYHNQYGSPQAYTGYLNSNSVTFKVVDEEAYNRIPDDGLRRPR